MCIRAVSFRLRSLLLTKKVAFDTNRIENWTEPKATSNVLKKTKDSACQEFKPGHTFALRERVQEQVNTSQQVFRQNSAYRGTETKHIEIPELYKTTYIVLTSSKNQHAVDS